MENKKEIKIENSKQKTWVPNSNNSYSGRKKTQIIEIETGTQVPNPFLDLIYHSIFFKFHKRVQNAPKILEKV